MSQNIPPNELGHPEDPRDQPSFASRNDAGVDANPYFNRTADDSAAELDAEAPVLRGTDEQRLNRKALVFLGMIVVLLAALAFFLFRGSSSDEEKVVAPKGPEVKVPELPNNLSADPTAPSVEPIPLDSVPPLPATDASVATGAAGQSANNQAGARGPTLLERRIMAENSGETGPSYSPAPGTPGAGAAVAGTDGERVSTAQFIYHPDTLLVRGTYIRCVLETRIITDIPGFTSCIVTEPVYSINGRRLLLPKGSKVLGAYDTDATGPRVAVIWDRITTPNGFDINMKSPGIDNLGSAGHPGKFTEHWGSRIGAALLISLVADAFKYAAAENGPQETTVSSSGVVVQSPYESATARTMESFSNRALQKSLNRPATVIINQGTVVNVYVAKDVDFDGVIPGSN